MKKKAVFTESESVLELSAETMKKTWGGISVFDFINNMLLKLFK